MKKKTIVEKYKYFKNKYILFLILQFVTLILPFAVLFIVKRKEYFTKANGIDLSAGLILSLILLVLILSKKTKILKGAGGYVAITLLAFLFRTIINDLVLILSVGLVGVLVSQIFTMFTNKYKKICDAFKKAVINKETLNSEETLALNAFGHIESE